MGPSLCESNLWLDLEPVVVLEDDKGTRVIVDFDSATQPASLRNFD